MVLVLCWWIRHLVAQLLMGRVSEPMWYQVGSWTFRHGSSLMAAKLTWYVRATFNMLAVSSSNFVARSPLGHQEIWDRQLELNLSNPRK